MRNRGAVLLARLAKTFDQTARELGVSTSIVSYWHNGQRTPGRANRRLLAERYKIPVEAWDEEYVPSKPTGAAVPVPLVEAADPTKIDDERLAHRILRQAEARLEQLEETDEMHPREASKTLLELTRSVEAGRKMMGMATPEASLVDRPEWARLKARILDALKPHPEALRAVVAALEDAP